MLENVCNCDNGTGARGAKCLKNGDDLCESCQPGYTLNENKKCEGRIMQNYTVP